MSNGILSYKHKLLLTELKTISDYRLYYIFNYTQIIKKKKIKTKVKSSLNLKN